MHYPLHLLYFLLRRIRIKKLNATDILNNICCTCEFPLFTVDQCSHKPHRDLRVYLQSACGWRHQGKNVANNMLVVGMSNGRLPIAMILVILINAPSLRMLDLIAWFINIQMIYYVSAIKRISQPWHVRSWHENFFFIIRCIENCMIFSRPTNTMHWKSHRASFVCMPLQYNRLHHIRWHLSSTRQLVAFMYWNDKFGGGFMALT